MPQMFRSLGRLAATATLALFMPVPAFAAGDVVLTIKDHRFQPAELHVPSGKKVKLIVRNEDSSAEEFESYELNREKIIPGNSQATVYVGPLEPGRYPFFGEFHQDTAQGTLIAD